MSDDNVIKLPTKEYEEFVDHINAQPARNAQLNELLTGDATISLSDGSTMEITGEGLGFEDIGAAINMRAWLQQAVEAKGAVMVGGGYGFGAADLDIELEGFRYVISMRPLK